MAESYKPTEGMIAEANRGLEWRREFGRGGTSVGIARARDISNGKSLPLATVKRMKSFFARHEVDKKAEGFRPGEKGYPSNGRIAWALWGGDAGKSWSEKIVNSAEKQERAEPLTGAVQEGLKNKADEHNEKVGDDARKRTNARTLGTVFRRGVGAYKTNPASVRPSVKSPEQWAYARVNSFLYVLRNLKFRSGKHDTDLLPEKHPLSTKGRAMDLTSMTERHVIDVEETDDEYIVAFAKAQEVAEEPEEREVEEVETRDLPVQTQYRTGSVRMMDDESDRRVMMSISSTNPVEREFGYEVLEHNAGSVDMEFMSSGKAPLLLDHDARQQIGVVERAYMDKDKLRAQVRFSKNAMAEEVYRDVVDGIRGNVSIGYQIQGMTKDENGYKDKPLYRVNMFKPLEVSMVSIPADSTVGVGRSKPEISGNDNSAIQEKTMSAEVVQEPVNTRQPEDQLKEYRNQSSQILELGKRHDEYDLAFRALQEEKSLAEFQAMLLEKKTSKPIDFSVDASPKEKRNYSLVRAIQAADAKDWSKAGFELEVSKELAKKQSRQPKGFFVPDFGWQTRTVSTAAGATFGAGSNIVPEDYRGDRFIDALISTSILGQVGATVLNGLQGNVAIPKISTSTAAAFIAEGGSVGNNEPDFAQVTMTPKLLANKVAVTRELMIQSDPSVEQLIRNNMVRIFAAKIDNVALKGGGSNEPTGILGTSGIGDVSSGGTSGNANLTYGNVVDIMTEVSQDNALLGNLRWVTHPAVVGKLMQTLVASSTDSRMVMPTPDSMLGYPVVQTTQAPSSSPYSLIFGNFADLYVGFFSALDVLVDPYGSAGTATTNLYFYQDCDIAVAHAESFAAAQDVTVA
jgi:HK97 family phage major capsid protein